MNCWSTGTKLEAHRSRWRHSKTANYLKDKYIMFWHCAGAKYLKEVYRVQMQRQRILPIQGAAAAAEHVRLCTGVKHHHY
jgi:hypothetical protein